MESEFFQKNRCAIALSIAYFYCVLTDDVSNTYSWLFKNVLTPIFVSLIIQKWTNRKLLWRKFRKHFDFADYCFRWFIINHLLGRFAAIFLFKLLSKYVSINESLVLYLTYFVLFTTYFFSSLLAVNKVWTKKDLIFPKSKRIKSIGKPSLNSFYNPAEKTLPISD
jgi:hypothetical protein